MVFTMPLRLVLYLMKHSIYVKLELRTEIFQYCKRQKEVASFPQKIKRVMICMFYTTCCSEGSKRTKM